MGGILELRPDGSQNRLPPDDPNDVWLGKCRPLARLGPRRLLDIPESLSLEQRAARLDTGTTYLFADGAVPMMRGVPVAFIGAARTRAHARLQQPVNNEIVPMGRSRQGPRGDGAHIRACQAKRGAYRHFGDVVLGEIGVTARRARLDTFQAGIDRRRDLPDTGWDVSRRGLQHVSGIRHASSLTRFDMNSRPGFSQRSGW
jgi:hypothetical protein